MAFLTTDKTKGEMPTKSKTTKIDDDVFAAFRNFQTEDTKFQNTVNSVELTKLGHVSQLMHKPEKQDRINFQSNLAAFGKFLDASRAKKGALDQKKEVREYVFKLCHCNGPDDFFPEGLNRYKAIVAEAQKSQEGKNKCHLKKNTRPYLPQALRYLAWFLKDLQLNNDSQEEELFKAQKNTLCCFQQLKKLDPQKETYLPVCNPIEQKYSTYKGPKLRFCKNVLPDVVGLSLIEDTQYPKLFKTFKDLESQEKKLDFMQKFEEKWQDAEFVYQFFNACPEGLVLFDEHSEMFAKHRNKGLWKNNGTSTWKSAQDLARSIRKASKTIMDGDFDAHVIKDKLDEKWGLTSSEYTTLLYQYCAMKPDLSFNQKDSLAKLLKPRNEDLPPLLLAKLSFADAMSIEDSGFYEEFQNKNLSSTELASALPHRSLEAESKLYDKDQFVDSTTLDHCKGEINALIQTLEDYRSQTDKMRLKSIDALSQSFQDLRGSVFQTDTFNERYSFLSTHTRLKVCLSNASQEKNSDFWSLLSIVDPQSFYEKVKNMTKHPEIIIEAWKSLSSEPLWQSLSSVQNEASDAAQDDCSLPIVIDNFFLDCDEYQGLSTEEQQQFLKWIEPNPDSSLIDTRMKELYGA